MAGEHEASEMSEDVRRCQASAQATDPYGYAIKRRKTLERSIEQQLQWPLTAIDAELARPRQKRLPPQSAAELRKRYGKDTPASSHHQGEQHVPFHRITYERVRDLPLACDSADKAHPGQIPVDHQRALGEGFRRRHARRRLTTG